MNKPILIQGALQSEIDYLLKTFSINREVSVGKFLFYECEYNDYPIIISKTKMGEVCSSIATTIGIQKYNPLFIINQGTAGALVEWLNKGDIVVGKKICYISQFSTDLNKENVDINPWKNDEYRTMSGEVISYDCDESFFNRLKSMKVLENSRIYFDIIGSGDIWTKDIETMKKYNQNYGVVCEAMECTGAYIAANSLNTPIVSVRIISNNEIKKQKYDESMGIEAQKLVIRIIEEFLSMKN